MPLPDERPRQSVANLIGRFEQQTKRQSLVGATGSPLRVPSVLSDTTGESAKEDAKKAREWPPKGPELSEQKVSAQPLGKLPSPAPSREAPTSPPASPPVAPVHEPITSSISTPEKLSSTVVPAPKQPQPPATPAATASPRTPGKLSSSQSTPNTRTLSKAATPKPSSSTASKSPPAAKPLRAQHTGQSVGSGTSAARTKLPSHASPATPSRPKTPSGVARPKTPSSGLYAPTAASLAKARAAPPVPTPTRRPTSSAANAVSERLSKPTAASASKARIPVPTPTPVRASKPPSRGATPARATVKPRVGHAPARIQQEKVHKEKAAAAAKVGAGIAGAGAATAAATGDLEKGHESLGNGAESQTSSADVEYEEGPGTEEHELVDEEQGERPESLQDAEEEIENYDDDFLDETIHLKLGSHDTTGIAEEEQVQLEPEDAEDVAEPSMDQSPLGDVDIGHVGEGDAAEVETLPPHAQNSDPTPQDQEDVEIAKPDDSQVQDGAPHTHEPPDAEPVLSDAATANDHGSDMQELVSMLESAPMPKRPSPAASISDDDATGVIPDDE